MTTQTVAILMPGDMGHAVGRALSEHGHRVVTCLAGRSAHTRGLAEQAGLEDVGSLGAVCRAADLILSILPPAAAVAQASAVADAMRESGATPPYVECNAISPETTRRAGDLIEAAGAAFIDGGIIGPAPGKGAATRFYVSGDDTAPVEALNGAGIEVHPMGPGIGRASGLKMCYAGLTKGTWTLQTAVLLAAHALDLDEDMARELAFSQNHAYSDMRERVPRLPVDSERWVGEMEEIAATFDAAGVPSGFHDAAAEIFRILARTPFAAETRETMDTSRTLEESVRVFGDHVRANAAE